VKGSPISKSALFEGGKRQVTHRVTWKGTSQQATKVFVSHFLFIRKRVKPEHGSYSMTALEKRTMLWVDTLRTGKLPATRITNGYDQFLRENQSGLEARNLNLQSNYCTHDTASRLLRRRRNKLRHSFLHSHFPP
jgi:hypothetical protein